MAEVETLRGRYELGEALGEGGFGATRLALDRKTGAQVVLKELDVRRAGDWKSIELFEREAQVLAELEHPAIPSYVDAFDIEEDGSTRFFLVQELAPGKTLDDLSCDSGWRSNRERLLELGRALLEVCAYLHELNPPVIHRDIKPANVMYSEDGVVSLVDFGSVKARWEERSGGSTVVGTLGYMAPEQLRGAADGRSDLFGVGSTLIFVLTRRDPEDLPTIGLRTDTDELLPYDPALARWLDGLIAPDPAARFESARAALAALDVLESSGTTRPEPADLEPDDAPGSEPVVPAPRPRPGTVEHTQSITRESVGLAIGAAVVMVVASIFFMSGPTGWGSALLTPVGLVICWGMTYAGLGAKNSIDTPASKRLESSGSMVASGLMATLLPMCVGFTYGASGLTGPSVLALVGLLPLMFFAWVLVVMEWDSWTEWGHRGVFEDELGVELPADSPSSNPLQMSRRKHGIAFGRGAGLTPWTLTSFGLMSLCLGVGLELGLGTLDLLFQTHMLFPIVGVTFPAIGVLVALTRLAWPSDKLVIEDDQVWVRHGGTTTRARPSEITGWDLTARRDDSVEGDEESVKHVVTLTLHLADGRAPMVYDETAENRSDARKKRAMLDAVLRTRIGGELLEFARDLHDEDAAVEFDWEQAWSEEQTVTSEVASASW